MLRVEYKLKQYVDVENCDFANVDKFISKIKEMRYDKKSY